MSHKAVNWALEQRDLKPGPWIVLIQLADRHNKDTKRISPWQSTLAADCNMSRSSVNNHLDTLEEVGLIRRVKRRCPKTKRRLATYYILRPDFGKQQVIDGAMCEIWTRDIVDQTENIKVNCENNVPQQEPCPKNSNVQNLDMEAMSKKQQEPCPKNSNIPVQNLDSIRTMEKNHGKEPCVDEPHTQFDFDGFLEKFKTAYPRLGDMDATSAELQRAINAGTDPQRILAGARAYSDEQAGNNRQYIAYSENWLRLKRWERYAAGSQRASQSEIDAFTANLIKRGKPELVRHVSPTRAAGLVHAGLVTAEECKSAEIRL